jgi:hypothetical protein
MCYFLHYIPANRLSTLFYFPIEKVPFRYSDLIHRNYKKSKSKESWPKAPGFDLTPGVEFTLKRRLEEWNGGLRLRFQPAVLTGRRVELQLGEREE